MESYWYLIIGGILLIGIILALVFKKNLLSFTGPAKAILEAAKTVVSAYGKASPAIITIIQAAIDGTVAAENLWKDGTIDKEHRNEYAQHYIQDVLDSAKVEYKEYQDVINCVITLVCYILPHSEEKA